MGDVRDVSRFGGRDPFAAYNGTAPIEVSSGQRKTYRLSRRGNRRLDHAIHMVAVTQVRHRHSEGRAKKARARPQEALRALKRQISNAIFACLQAAARRAAARPGGPGGQPGNDSVASAAGLHPRHRLFGQATPGPGHHTTTAAGNLAPEPAPAQGRGWPFPGRCQPAAGDAAGTGGAPAAKRGQTTWKCGKTTATPGREEGRGQGSLVKPQRPKGTLHAVKKTGEALLTQRLHATDVAPADG